MRLTWTPTVDDCTTVTTNARLVDLVASKHTASSGKSPARCHHLRVTYDPSWLVQDAKSKVPSSFEVLGQRKGFLRFMSPELRELVETREEAVLQRETALQGILKVRRTR